jgi:diadenosine tetraphosphate (Ap4A) HIT family hydrolase
MVELSRPEIRDFFFILRKMVRHLKEDFKADAYNIGVNCGEAAGQTLPHLHVHLVPRYLGDVPDPRGGIRKYLPNPLAEYP